MRGVLVALLIMLLIQLPTTIFAAEDNGNDHWKKLSDLSYKALQLTKAEKYADAKDVLRYFEDEYLSLSDQQKKLSMYNLRVFSTSYDESVKVLTSTSATHEERVDTLVQLHLLVDAVYSTHQPLWKSTKNELMRPLEQMKDAAANQELQSFYAYFNQFLSEYEKIHAALSVDLPQELLSRIDSYITYLDENRSLIVTTDHQIQQIHVIEAGLIDAFDTTKEDSADPSILWLIFAVGGGIISTLFYVGWRKYSGEKKEYQTFSKKKEYNRFR
ncbi:sporulation protein YpjB [Pseudalkalibacillus salsuginis]|uniref:sporulation protein YpjB n=1 Tax=Pseudalkalibacillus salsuginis TaxID=2910972 RepID=UPI001F264795|nr:sporulation protein YpjB [Pseudalkalibacillus salsuginis]MCF6408218.1 sporulation protein YpjB [Pseudalkalibacillus salsuginis]